MGLKSPKLLNKQRRYSELFKQGIVQEYESGRLSVRQLSKLHGIAFQSIYRWIHKYSSVNEKGIRIVEYGDSTEERLRQLTRQVSELQRLVGEKQAELELLYKLMEIAEQELGIDLKKSISTGRSGGSRTTKQ